MRLVWLEVGAVKFFPNRPLDGMISILAKLDRIAIGCLTVEVEATDITVASDGCCCRFDDIEIAGQARYLPSIGMAKEGAEDVGAIQTARPDNYDRG